jgi:hypothetical protein
VSLLNFASLKLSAFIFETPFPFSTFTKSSMVSLTCAIDTFVLARKGYNYKKYKQDMVPCQEFYIRTLIRKKDKGVEIFNHTMYKLIIIIYLLYNNRACFRYKK